MFVYENLQKSEEIAENKTDTDESTAQTFRADTQYDIENFTMFIELVLQTTF
jgi:hypothetical protein